MPTVIWSLQLIANIFADIWSSQLRSGSPHRDLELAVEVRQRTEIWNSLLEGRKDRKDGRRK